MSRDGERRRRVRSSHHAEVPPLPAPFMVGWLDVGWRCSRGYGVDSMGRRLTPPQDKNDYTRVRDAVARAGWLRSRCHDARIALDVSAESHYWRFRWTDDRWGRERRAEWWPLSGRLVFDARYKRGTVEALDVQRVWAEIEARWLDGASLDGASLDGASGGEGAG